MIGTLKVSVANMPVCFNYIVAEDSADENTVWVAEVWESAGGHDASLSLPAVRNVIPLAKQIVVNFDKIAVTNPVRGVGLRSASVL